MYQDKYRPKYHFTSPKGWLNDPNGLVYHNNEYHLFYQHNPDGNEWGNMTWGHAVSENLIDWQHLPHAITPYDNGTIFSGSAVVDHNHPNRLVAFYTFAKKPFIQCAAESFDDGKTWRICNQGNPVIANQGLDEEERDPKVFWHHESKQWVMLLWVSMGMVRIFASNDLNHWTYSSDLYLDGFYECPDIFKIQIEGQEESVWVVYDAAFNYWVGQFDGVKFNVIQDARKGDWGENFWAAQIWNNLENRIVQIAWMRGGVYPQMSFNQQMSFPCELSLCMIGSEYYLKRYPVAESTEVFSLTEQREFVELLPGDELALQLPSLSCDISAEIECRDKQNIVIQISDINISFVKGLLSINGQEVNHISANKCLDLRILLDVTSVEIFIGQGLVTCTSCVIMTDPPVLKMTSREFNCCVQKLSLNELR